ncbi:MAG: N-acetylglucosamine-6-phosphate deacetylase, partial [Shimia sp.]|nr:N-acetylglucosamine-6-phosphate deacetylase [Shimia sp.]
MTSDIITFRDGPIFDGDALQDGWAARFENGTLVALGPEAEGQSGVCVDLAGDILCPG